jgi:nucleoside-diphosphate-sugar epimerase
MRILVTGATGFIGKSVIQKFSDKENILAISRTGTELQKTKSSQVKWVQGSLDDEETLSQIVKFNPQAVLHLAWSGLPDYSIENNTRNFNSHIKLFGFLKKCSELEKIVFAGSCWEYGPVIGKVAEGQEKLPANLFATFKNSIRNIAESYFSDSKTKIVWGRVFFSYGPGQRSQALIPSLIDSFKNGRVPEIKNPLAVNDFVFIDDVAEAFVSLLSSKSIKSGVYNIGSGEPHSVAEVVNLVADNFGSSFRLPEPKIDEFDSAGFWANTSLICKEISWVPKLNFKLGIKDVCEKHS